MQMNAGHRPGQQDTPLFDLVFQRISQSPAGAIPFSEWMEAVLYDPGHGYYTSPRGREIGRKGDFYTSVSVGERFGRLLASRAAREWETSFGKTLPFVVVEQGGHDGQLARDFLAGLDETAPDLAAEIEYRLVDPREEARARLASDLGGAGADARIRVSPSLAAARAPQGLFLCNELLDAFPVDCLVFREGEWREAWVETKSENGESVFVWCDRPIREAYAVFVTNLGEDFPEGYRTEISPTIDAWVAQAANLFEKGLWWVIDYGHERPDYYRPDRTAGTLRAFRGHRSVEDPFAFPGEQDLTADVDFTRVEEAARRAGLDRRLFTDQHHFLVDAARPWLLAMEGRAPNAAEAKQLRQFQTLTHPGLMGRQFKVMELARGLSRTEDSPQRW